MRVVVASFLAFFGLASLVRAEVLELYIDADFSINVAAAEAIELGISTALAEVGDSLGGVPVELVRMDHRGNVNRSLRTMQQFAASETALAMIGGLHSPPYITHKDYVNDSRILTLLPWSAGAPITRASEGDENWFFRLSVDDTKSGEFFIREAMDRQGCQSIALILLDTGWGRSGETSMTKALAARDERPAIVEYFPVTIGQAAAGTIAQNIADAGADCAVMMANSGNGAVVLQALNKRAPGLRVFSHWGIMGDSFAENTTHDMREAHDLQVLQTCALRIEAGQSEVLETALRHARPEVQSVAEIGAITGFVHGYDLGRLLISAAEQASQTSGWQSGIADRRMALKDALENLEDPIDGILKTYQRPFAPWTLDNPDAHEA